MDGPGITIVVRAESLAITSYPRLDMNYDESYVVLNVYLHSYFLLPTVAGPSRVALMNLRAVY
jgi:hypothetical protein